MDYDERLLAENKLLKERLSELEQALKPIAEFGQLLSAAFPDGAILIGSGDFTEGKQARTLTAGDFRAAANAIREWGNEAWQR